MLVKYTVDNPFIDCKYCYGLVGCNFCENVFDYWLLQNGLIYTICYECLEKGK